MDTTDQRLKLNESVENEAELYNHLMHVATYQFAARLASGKKILDYGCGSGYGAHLLSATAFHVTGVDLDESAVRYARDKYHADNLMYKLIPEVTNEKFDIISSFQVIEHVRDDKAFIEKLKSMLNPGGCILISTPDKKNRLFRFIQKPWNIYHLREYSVKSLDELLKPHFSRVEILKIGSTTDLVKEEISRTKKQRLISLPFTLFIYPNAVRVFMLNLAATLFQLTKKIASTPFHTAKKISTTPFHTAKKISTTPFQLDKEISSKETKSGTMPDIAESFKVKNSVKDIEISADAKLNTDLLAVCYID